MRAKFIYEVFKEDSDPVKDMGIGLTRHIQNIRKALKKMEEPEWEEEDYIEDEYVIKLDSTPDYVKPDVFSGYKDFEKDWDEIGVFDPFEVIYYFDIDLQLNVANRVISIKNPNIEEWEWWDQKILSDDPISLSPEEIVEMIKKDWLSHSDEAAAIEAHEQAEANYEKTAKRISTY